MEICIRSGVTFMRSETAPENLSDDEIITLFFERNEKALSAVSRKYENYCGTVVRSIIKNPQDAEECLNDTWLKTWESIPPARPKNLGGFLAKIAKNISLNRYEHSRAKKRGGGELPLVLDELSECVADKSDVEKTFEQKVLTDAVNEFLRTLPRDKRDVFVLRYWYCLSVAEIANKTGLSRGSVSVSLTRSRRKLAAYLKKAGLI